MKLRFKEEQHDHEMAAFNFGFVKMAYTITKASDYVDLWRIEFHARVYGPWRKETLNEVIGKEAAIEHAQLHYDCEIKRLSA